MTRRDVLRALAAGALAPLGLQRPRSGRRPRPPRSPWTFRLDRSARWTLAARDGHIVVGGAESAVLFADGDPIPLAALQHARRFQLTDAHGGNAGWQVVGTAGGVEVSAQFLDGPPPRVTVSARGLEDPQRLEAIRFFDTGGAEIPALGGRPAAWINGYRSTDPCRLVALGAGVDATSHWQLAILPGASPHPTAFGFGADDAGEGRFDCAAGRVTAVSRFGGRAIGAAHPPAIATLAIVPSAEPLRTLWALVGPAAALPRAAPTGFSPARALPEQMTQDAILADLDGAGAAFRPGAPRLVLLDDGYQRAVGDWDTNARFPNGHRWLTDRIHAAGFQAGLWLAPLLVAEASGIPAAHPDWLLATPDRVPLVVEEPAARGGKAHALDAAQGPVRDYLRDLVRHAVLEWGYDFLTLDHLGYAAAGAHAGREMSGAEAGRAALRALREGAGRAFIVGCDVPLQQAVGLVDAVRLGPGAPAGIAALRETAAAVALRAHFHGSAWLSDPGSLAVGDSLSLDEARLWATVVALSGGPDICAGAPGDLPAERLDVLKRTLPVARLEPLACDLSPESPGRAPFPAWLLGQIAEDWWVLAALNWSEHARHFSLSLADHGIRGPLLVYDVWEDQRRTDVDGQVQIELAPHAAAVLSLRRRRVAPCVIGSTRHVVPGLELRDERWDGRRRVLAAQAVALDDRPYAATIALPRGFRPRRATSSAEAGTTVEMAGRGEPAARLVIATPPSEAVSWSVEF